MSDQDITGNLVILKPATIQDRRLAYESLAHSDITCLMSGPPTFPDKPIEKWEQFFDEYYFDGSAPRLGRCFLISVDGVTVGQIFYNDIFENKGHTRTELDIWMSSRTYCGKGYGVDALVTLCRFLFERFGVDEVMVQPSARNPQAIRAYEKAGFEKLDSSDDKERESWGPCDYHDSVHMIKHFSASQ
jgi:RimJ/RimL family protein N-acetyltransferase